MLELASELRPVGTGSRVLFGWRGAQTTPNAYDGCVRAAKKPTLGSPDDKVSRRTSRRDALRDATHFE
ncbi:MAG TPA: hypothetical protein VKP30_05820, partial [Polyangiaceae bacterium]|nr:hypothetical protein [Polyangiaceae bacterium]